MAGERIRMTAQSKTDIKAAVSAELHPTNGGYNVTLQGVTGKVISVEVKEGVPAVYPSKVAATKAIHRHNPALLNVALKPRI